MKIEIVGWESEGLRCPDVKIDLTVNEEIAPVVLIQMPNGTGKTTTLTMIRAAMNGEARNWNPDKIRSFRRPGESHSEGFFILHLWVDGRPLTFELKLDFDEGKAEYKTSSIGSGGIIPNWEPPPDARPFFDDRFVKLFIFDGELAKKLLDSEESEASKAIDALFQLYLLEEIEQKAEAAWEQATKDKAKSKQGRTLYQNKVKKLKKQIDKVADERKKAREELSELQQDIELLDQKINAQISTQDNLSKDLEAKKEQERDARREVEDSASEVMTRMRQPHLLHEAFARSLVELKDQLDRLRLPASTSSQFFTELLEEKDCICGRPLDGSAREEIAKRQQLYLAEDASGIINALKQDIEVQVRQEGNETAADLTEELDRLGRAVDNKLLAETEVRVLKRQSIDRGDDELKAWAEERDQKATRKLKLESRLKEIEQSLPRQNNDENTLCLPSLEKQLKEAEKKLAELSDTLELRAKTDILKAIMLVAVTEARANLQEAICLICNQRLRKVLSRDPVRIGKIDRCLQLREQEGASEGQTLSVAYIFLTTLLSRGRGQHQFPLIFDSPANSLDLEVRRQIARLIPDLCEQFVALTISSEREGFTDELDASSGKRTKFLTLFGRSPRTKPLMRSLPNSGVTTTPNAVLVEGKDYFDRFDLETVED